MNDFLVCLMIIHNSESIQFGWSISLDLDDQLIIAYFYIFDIIYIKDKISETQLHVDANYANWDFFNIFFVNIQSFEFN